MARVFVGVDWGHEATQVVVEDEVGGLLWKARVEMKAAELDSLVGRLRAFVGAGKDAVVEVGIERKAGRLVDVMLAAGFRVWFVKPAQVDDARKLRFSSKAKDDLRDALVIAWLIRAMPEGLAVVEPPSVGVTEVRRLSVLRNDIVGKHTAVQNQVSSRLREVFPEILEVTMPRARWFPALWRLLRTPQHAQSVSVEDVRKVLKAHRVRVHTAEEVVAILRPSRTLADHGDWSFEVELLTDQLEVLSKQLDRVEKRLEEQLAKLGAEEKVGDAPTDVEILVSVPGIGAILCAILIAEQLPALLLAGVDTARSIAGVAPVLSTSGKSQTQSRGHVGMRQACNPRLRHALHLAVEKGFPRDPWMKMRYRQLRARGHTHGRACRQMADGLLRRIAAMLRDRKLYDADRAIALPAASPDPSRAVAIAPMVEALL